MKVPIFPSKYHQNGGFSMAMLVYRSVLPKCHVSPRKKNIACLMIGDYEETMMGLITHQIPIPMGSMYAIFTYIYHKEYQAN